jgi:hypothetical protein
MTMTSLRQAIDNELAQALTALDTSRKGAAQNPDDEEWSTMVELYTENVAALRRLQTIANDEPKPIVAVVMDGGLVHSVNLDGPEPHMDLLIVDYDVEGSTDEVQLLDQGDGTVMKALINGVNFDTLDPAIAADLRHFVAHNRTMSTLADSGDL